jgi:hypothetical protein
VREIQTNIYLSREKHFFFAEETANNRCHWLFYLLEKKKDLIKKIETRLK